jgi:hypothetical protein
VCAAASGRAGDSACEGRSRDRTTERGCAERLLFSSRVFSP